MKSPAVKEYGQSLLIEVGWNLHFPSSQKIAAIITIYSGEVFNPIK